MVVTTRGKHPAYGVVRAGTAIALARWAVLGLLLALHWTERMTYWHAIFMIFLLPEGLLLPSGMEWTATAALAAAALIAAGSFLWAFLMFSFHRLLSSRGAPG